jgi:hypothetical protein
MFLWVIRIIANGVVWCNWLSVDSEIVFALCGLSNLVNLRYYLSLSIL